MKKYKHKKLGWTVEPQGLEYLLTTKNGCKYMMPCELIESSSDREEIKVRPKPKYQKGRPVRYDAGNGERPMVVTEREYDEYSGWVYCLEDKSVYVVSEGALTTYS